jgi:hypothetical protein
MKSDNEDGKTPLKIALMDEFGDQLSKIVTASLFMPSNTGP